MWNLIASSRNRSTPVYAYRVTYGPDGDIRFTNSEAPVVIDGLRYDRYPGKHGNINASASLDNSSVTVESSRNNPLTELFRTSSPEYIVNIQILRGELGSEEFTPIWHGRIVNFARKGAKVLFTCDPVSTQMRRPGLRRNYQVGCPLLLYGPECRVDRSKYEYPATVNFIENSQVVLINGWLPEQHAAHRFLGGLLIWYKDGGEILRQLVANSDNNTWTVDGIPEDLQSGDEVVLALGCPHTLNACRDTFDNTLNYGGQPWIPLDNPLGPQNNFY